jgi:hypothetical protein
MAFLAMIGIAVVLIGLVVCGQRADDYWSNRSKKIKTLPRRVKAMSPPFRTSPNQCTDCGSDDGPLSIDTHQCQVCFELVHG